MGADLDAWLAGGGGTGLRNALAGPGRRSSAVIAAADLRGMGGAGFPTHRKWAMIAAHKDCDKFVVCNGNEDEPGTFKDRFLLEHTPHQVIEGALIAAVATARQPRRDLRQPARAARPSRRYRRLSSNGRPPAAGRHGALWSAGRCRSPSAARRASISAARRPP